MPKDRWVGYIKDYDGGTLMECYVRTLLYYCSSFLFLFVCDVSVSLLSVYGSLLAFSDTTWRLTIIPLSQ
jgi:hypothetical protein